jgi:mono/diheme cytochrome c family protein
MTCQGIICLTMQKGLMVVAAVLVSAIALRAQQAPQPRIWQGVYTAAQAERGKATFLVTCQRCHNADLSGDRGPALKGERFMTTWGGGGVNRLFEKIRDTMPPFATSTLDDATKLDIVTFILQTNGFPAGERDLAAADLESIDIVAQGEVPKAQNFARVQVVGCLARGDENRFVLTSASEPVPAASDTASLPVPAQGTGQVVLLNAAQFNPASQVGQRVDARGLVYRDDRDTLLTVSALKAVGSCQN